MNTAFADTWYLLALLNSKDRNHVKAASFSITEYGRILTTRWVLTEVADALCSSALRPRVAEFIQSLHAHPTMEIESDESKWFDRGLELYERRNDKGWPLTDCISFVIMRDRIITDALTGDRHFEQAGFRALLK